MLEDKIKRLDDLLTDLPELLRTISEEDFCKKPAPNKWSRKEILGHLIDSATNNHHRFIRSQFESIPSISYNQDEWNKYNFYSKIESSQVINFWEIYNKQILALIKCIPQDGLNRLCNSGGEEHTIEFLFIDYVNHLEHHLRQIIKYE